MALEHLIATLEREAHAEADGVFATARAEATMIRASAGEREAQRRQEATGTWESRVDAQVEQGLIEERRAAGRAVLERRHEILRQVMDAARVLFPVVLESDGYRARLVPWTREALECIGARPARILCHPSLVSEITKVVAGRKNVTVVGEAPVGAGFKAVTEGDTLQVDCTLEGRLQALLPVVSMEVIRQFDGRT